MWLSSLTRGVTGDAPRAERGRGVLRRRSRNRGHGRRGTERSGCYARPWAKSRRGFRWALPEDEAPVPPPKIATWSAERRPPVAREDYVAPRKRDGLPVTRSGAPPPLIRGGEREGKRKQRTRGRKRAAGTKKTARQRQGYGGACLLARQSFSEGGCAV
jgi:hypothetical protein